MKLAIDARGVNLYGGSGIGTYTNNLILNMLEEDKEDSFNLIWTGEKRKEFLKNNSKLYLTSGRYGGFYETFYTPQLIEKEGFDLYHIPQNGIGFPFNYDVNVVVTIHDLIPYTMPETVGKGYLTRFLKDMPEIIEYSKGIITVSEFSKKDILRFFPNIPEEKIFVTPLATNSSFIPIEKDYCKEFIKNNFKITDPYILYLGGFSTRKNVKELIYSFSKIYKDLKIPYKLLLGGSLKDEGLALRDLVFSLGMQENILFTGFIKDETLPILYSGADVFCYPSLYEGFGLPPLEAMSCKTCVITSNLTSIPEVTENNAILIDPFNKDELSTNLLKVLNNPDEREEFAEKGYAHSKNFTWQKTAKKTIDAYKNIMLTC